MSYYRRPGLDGIFDDLGDAVGGPSGSTAPCPCGRGGVMRWVAQYQRWYCQTCNQYPSVQQQQPAPQAAVCPHCNAAALFYSYHYQRWYCNSCKTYAETPSVHAAGTAAAATPATDAATAGAGAGSGTTAASQTVIDDLFLLYTDGRLIRHATRRLRPNMDSDILGGMLTAIQEFVRQTIATEDDAQLEAIHVGRNTVYLHKGRYICLAVLVDGEDVDGIHTHLKAMVQDIEQTHEGILANWEGDLASLKPLTESVNALMAGTYRPPAAAGP